MSTRANDQQWVEMRGGRPVTITEHPVRPERVEFLNEPDDPTTGPITLKFILGVGHEVGIHTHPKQVETITVNEGAIRATIDDESERLEIGDNRRIPAGVPHGYEVVGEEEAVLSVSITPALSFKEFVVAEHALTPEAYGSNGLNLPYTAMVAKRYGLMLAPPTSGLQLRIFLAVLNTIGRFKGYTIPDDPLPVLDDE